MKTPEGITHSIKNEHSDSLNLPSQDSFFANSKVIEAKNAEESEETCRIERKITLKASYLEIYNESVNDLLDSSKQNLDVRDHKGEVFVDQLTSKEVGCAQDIIDVLAEGDQLRRIAETKQNSKSSRSHSVFRISVEIEDKDSQIGRRTIRSSHIQIVDLAGSEGASKTRGSGIRQREGGNINKSLLALSTVIYRLSQRQQMGSKNNYYINFRDSKLTRILQNSLCGKSQTAIICCISSLASNVQESLQALHFGTKAKRIRTQVNMNEIIREQPDKLAAKMGKMTKEIAELKLEIARNELLIQNYQQQELDLANIGPLKIHLENLEFQLAEQQEGLVSLRLNNEDLKEQVKEKKRELEQERHEGEVQGELQQSLYQMTEALQGQVDSQLATMAALNQQIESLRDQNKCMQQKIEFTGRKGNNCAADGNQGHEQCEQKARMRVSELLLSDNLIHEENAKAISRLKERGEQREAENRQLQRKLEEARKQNEALEKKEKSAQAQIQMLKSENRKHQEGAAKQKFQVEGLMQKVKMQKETNDMVFKELEYSMANPNASQLMATPDGKSRAN